MVGEHHDTVDAIARTEQGGDAACWAHLVCEKCGRVTEPDSPHRCEGDDDAVDPAL